MRRKDNVSRFLGDMMIDLISNKVTVRMHKSRRIDGKYGGLYWGGDKELDVAFGRPIRDWLGDAVHEYCHFLQEMQKGSVWYTCDKYHQNFFEWLEGDKDIVCDSDVLGAIELERDCDMRAVSLIRQYDLPINLDRYIKSSNAYLFSYQAMYKKRQWTDKKGAHGVNDIVEIMPNEHLPLSHYKKMPEGFYELVENNCFK